MVAPKPAETAESFGVSQAAKFLGLSASTIRNWRADGRLPGGANRGRWTREELLEAVKSAPKARPRGRGRAPRNDPGLVLNLPRLDDAAPDAPAGGGEGTGSSPPPPAPAAPAVSDAGFFDGW